VEGVFVLVFLFLEELDLNTSILTIALAGALMPGLNLAPTWHTNYGLAQQQSAAQKKPLVVVFGSGANGWAKVIRAEAPTPEVAKLLFDNYVCVYVDTANSAGKKIAQDFEISGSVGVVIGDRKGLTQAFWHQGDLTNASMTSYLTKYADPNVLVQGTETANTVRTSYYPGGTSSQGGTRTISSANC
jgi:hypothetical protein